MPKPNSLLDFVEHQEILNNIQTSITKIYHDDPEIHAEGFLEALTLETIEVINHMDGVYFEMLEEEGLSKVAEQFKTSKEVIAKDIVELMLYTTIARQSLLIDKMTKELIGDDE